MLVVDATGARTTVLGDWDDLDAAIDVGLSAIEGALLSKDQPDPGHLVCTLVTIRDDEGIIDIRQLDPPPAQPDLDRPDVDQADELQADATPPGPSLIEIRARIGRFGDRHDVERTLVQTISRRLAQLRGRDAAPVR